MKSDVEISASILNVPKIELHRRLLDIDSLVDYIHIDVMDGLFVSNRTPGVDMFKDALRFEKKPLDVHLMVEDPLRELSNYVGASIITFHVETIIDTKTMMVDMGKFNEISREIRKLGAKVGIAVKPNTTVSLLRNILKKVDLVLIMTVEPGYGGQKLIPKTLEKLEMVKKSGFTGLLEVDGGIDENTCKEVTSRGANLIVAGTGLFFAEDPFEAGKKMKNLDE